MPMRPAKKEKLVYGKMDDDQLASIIGAYISESLGYDADELSANRTDNLAKYDGELENLVEGRSAVQSRDALEVVEMAMPAITRTFLGSEPAAVRRANAG